MSTAVAHRAPRMVAMAPSATAILRGPQITRNECHCIVRDNRWRRQAETCPQHRDGQPWEDE